jgi:hypothetical protein
MNKTIKTIPDETMRSLVRYPWPGNIRELQNVIERAVILSFDSVLRVAISQLEANNAPVSNLYSAHQSEDHGNIRRILEGIERDQIQDLYGPGSKALDFCNAAFASVRLTVCPTRASMSRPLTGRPWTTSHTNSRICPTYRASSYLIYGRNSTGDQRLLASGANC